jgi:hypothetical protein
MLILSASGLNFDEVAFLDFGFWILDFGFIAKLKFQGKVLFWYCMGD